MTCTHDLSERETACADVYCPLCSARELDRLRRFVDFVNLWCSREGPFECMERLHAIKFHPVAQAAMKEAA